MLVRGCVQPSHDVVLLDSDIADAGNNVIEVEVVLLHYSSSIRGWTHITFAAKGGLATEGGTKNFGSLPPLAISCTPKVLYLSTMRTSTKIMPASFSSRHYVSANHT